ncbi:MAG: hypothetical protein ACP5RE_03570 [Candidatus Acidifodinimicrobium sp.]
MNEEQINANENVKGFYIPICQSHALSDIRDYVISNQTKIINVAIPDDVEHINEKCVICGEKAVIWVKVNEWNTSKFAHYNQYSRFKGFVPKVERMLTKEDEFMHQLTTYLGLKDLIGHDLALSFLKEEKNQLQRKLLENLELNLNEMNFRIKRIKYLKSDGNGGLIFQPMKSIGDDKVDIPLSDIDIRGEKMAEEKEEVKETTAKDTKTLLRERRISIYGVRRILKDVGFEEEVLPGNVYRLVNGKTSVVLYLHENKVEINGQAFSK